MSACPDPGRNCPPQRRNHQADATLIVALAAGRTQQVAADLAGVSDRTVRRRLDDPDFKQRVRAERGALISRSVGRLAEGSVAAADVLLDVALDPQTPPNARVSAARSILELGVRLRESSEIAERLEALEAAYQ